MCGNHLNILDNNTFNRTLITPVSIPSIMVSETNIKTIQQILYGCILILFIFIGTHLFYQGEIAIGSLTITVSIAVFSIVLAITSERRMRAIGEADIQSSIIKMLEIRRRYFDDLEKYFEENRRATQYRREKLKGCTEWATWMNYRCLRKAMKHKKYLLDDDKGDILRGHKILLSNIMKNDYVNFEFIKNRHVNQLLAGCKLLKKELKDLKVKKNNYEELYEEALSDFTLDREEGEDFISYIDRNLSVLSKKEEDDVFHILSE
jgi:hypothetical protein